VGDCDLAKSVKIGQQGEERKRDAFFRTYFGVKKKRTIQEKTIKDNKKMGPKFF
jgi:hypothetical protein